MLWVARDKDGRLYLHVSSEKPIREGDEWMGYSGGERSDFLSLPNDLYPELTWGDEPVEVEIIRKRRIKKKICG